MTEARCGHSIVPTMKAAGYPECEALTVHPLAPFSKRCDGRAEDERSESSSNEWLGAVFPLFPLRRISPMQDSFDSRPGMAL
jgi:hypothetical protein